MAQLAGRVAGARCALPPLKNPCARVGPRRRLKRAARALQVEVPVACAGGFAARVGMGMREANVTVIARPAWSPVVGEVAGGYRPTRAATTVSTAQEIGVAGRRITVLLT